MYNLDAIVFSGWEISLIFPFCSAYPFNIFLENRMTIELNRCSSLYKFINDISKIMTSNVCQHTQQHYMFIECLPALHFCHNMSTELCHLYCKKYKVLKKLYLPCSCTCSPHNFRYRGQSWQSTRVSIALQKFQIGAIFRGYLLVFLSEIHQVDEEARCFPSTNQKT